MSLNNTVLFSAIGATDPVRDNFDGPMLHIARHYRPKKVYLYFSEEMAEMEYKDNKCEKMLKILEPDIQVEKIVGHVKPNDFDGFIAEFNPILNRICQENEGSRVLLNITSGTTQMNATLCLEAITSGKEYLAVQVNTPQKGSNKRVPFACEADSPQKLMEENLDNQEGAEMRCKEPSIQSFRYSMLKSQIKAMVAMYDYEGGAVLAQDYNNSKVKKLINHCQLRMNLKHTEAKEVINDYEGHRLFPVSESRAAMLVEYLLMLKIKQKKGQLTDMIIGLNPFLIEVMSDYIEKVLKVPVKEFYTTHQSKRKKEIKVSSKKIENFDIKLLNYLDGSFTYGFREDGNVSVDFLYYVVEYYSSNDSLKADMVFYRKLREINSLLRNSSAHSLIVIDEKNIHDVSSMNSGKIISELEKQIRRIYKNSIPENSFEIYDEINGWIFKELDIYDDHSICI